MDKRTRKSTLRDIGDTKPWKKAPRPPGAVGPYTAGGELPKVACYPGQDTMTDPRLASHVLTECPAIRAAMEGPRPPTPEIDVQQLYEFPFRRDGKDNIPCRLPDVMPRRPCEFAEEHREMSDVAAKTLEVLDQVDLTEAMKDMERTEKHHPEAVAEAMVKKILEAIKVKRDSIGKGEDSGEKSKTISPVQTEPSTSTSTEKTETMSVTETESESDKEVPRSVVEAMVDKIWSAVLDLRKKTYPEEISGEWADDRPEALADKILKRILDEVDDPLRLGSERATIAKAVVDDVLKEVDNVVVKEGRKTADNLVELLMYKAARKAEESSTSEDDLTPSSESPLTKHRPFIWDEEEKQFEIFWNIASPRGHLKCKDSPDYDSSCYSRFEHEIDCLVEVIKLIKAWRDERKAEKAARKRADSEGAAEDVLGDMLDKIEEPDIIAADVLDELVDKADETEKMVTDLIDEDMIDKVDEPDTAAIDILDLLFGKVDEPQDAVADVVDQIIDDSEVPHSVAKSVLDKVLREVDSSEAVAGGLMDMLLEKVSDQAHEDDELLALQRYKQYEKYFPERQPEWSPEPQTIIPEDTVERLLHLQAATECWLTNILDPYRPLSEPKPKEKILIPADITGMEPEAEEEEEENPEDIVGDILKDMCDVPLEGDAILDSILDKVDEPYSAADNLFNRMADEAGAAELAATDAMDSMLKNLEEPEAVINNLMDWVFKTQIEEPSAVVNELLDSLIDNTDEPEKNIQDLMDSILKYLNDYDNVDDLVANILDFLVGDVGEQVLAKFHLENDRCFSRVYKATIFLKEIGEDLAKLCEVPEDMIVLVLDGVIVLSKDIFFDNKPMRILRKRRSVLHFALSSHDDLRYPLRTDRLTEETPRVTTRLVRIVMDDYEARYVRVAIYDETIDKPYVGGYRNKKTGVELHHAFTQTGPRPKILAFGSSLTHRDTQTARLKNLYLETVIHKTQQMWRKDVYITPEYDYIITAKPYIDADEALRRLRLDENARIIQRAWRHYLLLKYIRRYAYQYRLCKEYDELQQQKYVREIADQHKESLVRKTYPRTKTDFDMWYAMIEKWRLEQTRMAHEMRDDAARKAALKMVLLQEVELLRELEAHRTRLREEKKEKKGLRLIDSCAKPVEWTSFDGCLVSMDTVRTQRARELRELYHLLARRDCSVEERIEVLMNAKYALQAHNSIMAFQLTKLLERESELLLAGLECDEVEMLRQRILQIFLELLKDPEFNPEASKHILEYNTNKLEYTFHLCLRCRKLKKKVDTAVEANLKALQHCANCDWIQFIGSRRWNLNPYRFLMRSIRREEAKRHCFSSLAFVMQDTDFYWLIDNLWHSQSFLTEKRDISEMRMPRWDVDEDWTPWNCILLTNYESKWHLRLPTLEQGYSQDLMDEVHHRHLAAKLHFRRLMDSDKYFREGCKWFEVTRGKSYVPPSERVDQFDENL